MKSDRRVDEDTKVVSREQDDEDKNLPHIPSSEDSIALKTPSMQGEESVSGSMPDPASDDDMLEDAHAMGEQQEENLEHPESLNIARDMDKAQKEHNEA